MRKNFSKENEIWKMFSRFYQIVKQFHKIKENDDQYWIGMVKVVTNFSEKYKEISDNFSIKLSIAYLEAKQEGMQGSKEFTSKTPERIVLRDFWNLYCQYYIIEDNEEYWQRFTKATVNFGEKFKENSVAMFSIKLAMALVEQKQEEEKKQKLLSVLA